MPLFNDAEIQAMQRDIDRKQSEKAAAARQAQSLAQQQQSLRARQLAALRVAYAYFKQAAAEYVVYAKKLGLQPRKITQYIVRKSTKFKEVTVWDIASGWHGEGSDWDRLDVPDTYYAFYDDKHKSLFGYKISNNSRGEYLLTYIHWILTEAPEGVGYEPLPKCALSQISNGQYGEPLPEQEMRINVNNYFRDVLQYQVNKQMG